MVSPRFTTILFMLLMLTCLSVNVGCSTTAAGPSVANANKVPVSAQINDIYKNVKAGHMKAIDLQKLIEDMQSGKEPVGSGLPKAHEFAVQIVASLDTATTDLPKAASSAETEATARAKAEAEVAAAKQADPQRKVIRAVGYGTLFAGLAAVLAGFFVPALINFAWVRTAGAGLIIFGLLTLTIEYYLTQIRWVLLGVLAAAAVTALVWLWVHRKTLAEDAKWILKPINAGASP